MAINKGVFLGNKSPAAEAGSRIQTILFIGGRLFLGGLFIYASVYKIIDPASFADSIWRYQILPGELIPLAALVLPWVEIIAGVFLIAGLWLPGAIAVIDALLVTFFCALLFNVSRGLDISCGCFNSSPEAVSHAHMWSYVFRDGALLLVGFWVFWEVVRRRSRRFF